ncbi:VanZ family protein [Paeniglutamicibacter kerguelensis]|uniref:Glycopeptide antibiotics resistance protein n=1 Tax=Paeniglutamicibacter kerguelensis TaxID=254788 RepID=A0ABS4XEP1_9MICC|nr:VanZ family protein [Paeniglutamicibacter kerguelensis]MBP2386821.1 glycopeptide antibiotics resistance protein [Paeniglutamicibacter kerguelensis]
MTKLNHRVLLLLAFAYLLTLACIAFWPTEVDRPINGTLRHAIRWLHAHGMPSFIRYKTLEFTANIALFAPLGYVFAAVWARKWWHPVLIGFAVSCVIEVGQALLLPNRHASSLDIVANTLGAAVGAGIFVVARRLTTLQPTAIPLSGRPRDGEQDDGS